MPSRLTSVPDRDQLLVVEDDAAQRVGLQQLLKSWGFAVEVAIDGQEALEKIADRAADHRPERPRHAAAWAGSTCCARCDSRRHATSRSC